jgi:hypothetical protein
MLPAEVICHWQNGNTACLQCFLNRIDQTVIDNSFVGNDQNRADDLRLSVRKYWKCHSECSLEYAAIGFYENVHVMLNKA